MEAVVAVIAAVGAVAVAWINNRNNNKNTARVLSKIQTNHGKEPFEYLEMVAEVAAKVDALEAYTRDRNHDVLNGIHKSMTKTELLGFQMRGYVEEDAAAHERMEQRLRAIEARMV